MAFGVDILSAIMWRNGSILGFRVWLQCHIGFRGYREWLDGSCD